MRSDDSIQKICIAAIMRHTIGPIDFLLTRLYKANSRTLISIDIALTDGELPVSQTFIDKSDWTLVTTRRIVSCFNGEVCEASANIVDSWKWGDFKGYKGGQTSIGEILLNDGSTLKIHLEVDKASMIMIYSIITLVELQKNNNELF